MSENLPNDKSGNTVVIIKESRGSAVGICALIFAILSIFFLAIVFVPLAIILSIIAIVKKRYVLGICALIIAVVSMMFSPTFWAFGVSSLFAGNVLGISSSSSGSGSATDSAIASSIVTDLRSIQAATLMFYGDSMDAVPNLPSDTDMLQSIKQYLDDPNKYDNCTLIIKRPSEGTTEFWAGYDLQKAGTTGSEVKERLASRADGVGIRSASDSSSAPYSNQDIVWMRCR